MTTSAYPDETTALKPCPFCGGGRLDVSPVSNTGGNRKYVWCHECDAQGPSENGPTDNAVAAWNRRAAGKADV